MSYANDKHNHGHRAQLKKKRMLSVITQIYVSLFI